MNENDATASAQAVLDRAQLAGEMLFHTAGGTRLHIKGCAHFFPHSQLIATTAQDAVLRTLCSSCDSELSGHGRNYCTTLDDAFRDFAMPVESQAQVREMVARTETDLVWIPYSRAYIALAKDGVLVLEIGKTYIELNGERTPLAGYPGNGSGGRLVGGTPRAMPVCEIHHETLPATGICDSCA